MAHLRPALIDGVMSPRMHARLSTVADVSADTCREMNDMLHFTKFQPISFQDADESVFLLHYVPPDFRHEVFKSFAFGWAQCLESVAVVLRSGHAPTPAAVNQELNSPNYDARYTSHFLGRGGRVEHAIAAIFGSTASNAAGYPEEIFKDLLSLPAHPLDLDYKGVAAKMGILSIEGYDSGIKYDYEDGDDDE